MQNIKLNKKVVFVDILLISLISFGIVFASSWIYSNIISINGREPQILLTSNVGPNPVVNETFTLTALLTFDLNPLSGKNITFFEDDLAIGSGITDIDGYALLSWNVKVGIHQYKAGLEVV